MPNNINRTKARGEWVDGVYFRSNAELERYKELKRREDAGMIEQLEIQPVFHITHPVNGRKVCKYVGDFRYWHDEHGVVVEDVKGMLTDVYKLKKTLMRVFFDIEIAEVVPRPITRNKQVVGYRWKVNGEWE